MDFKIVKEKCPRSWDALKEWFRLLDFIPEAEIVKIKAESEWIDLVRAGGHVDRFVPKDLYGFFDNHKVYVGIYPHFDNKLNLLGYNAIVTTGQMDARRQRGISKQYRDVAEKTAFAWAFQMLEVQLTQE